MGASGDAFMKIALALVGKARGGVARVAVTSICLVGSITGSPRSDVMITGSFTIPMMKRTGYKPVFAGVVEAVASTGGVVTPPVMGGSCVRGRWRHRFGICEDRPQRGDPGNPVLFGRLPANSLSGR